MSDRGNVEADGPIELFGCGSPNVVKILFMLSECGLPYVLRELNVAAGDQFEPGFLRLNPNAKLPVIVDPSGPRGPRGEPHVVFESGAILIYLAEKCGRLLPGDPCGRSRALQWLMWQVASVGPMFGQALHFRYVAPEGNDYARRRYFREVERLYDVMELRLAQVPWLAGSEFSIADIAVFPWAGKYVKTLDIDLARRPSVARWIEAVSQRPGWQAIEADGKALFKRGLELLAAATPVQRDRFFGRL